MSAHLTTLIATMAGAVKDLQADTKANVRDLKNMTARMSHMDDTLSTLAGTVAGIGTIVEKLFADHKRVETLEKENASVKQSLAALARRVEALEKKKAG